MEIGGWEAIKLYVALGMGISIISSIGLSGEEELEVIPAREFFPQRMYGVVVRKTGILTPLAQRFIHLLLRPNSKPGGVPLHGGERTKPARAAAS
jgi:DNA-binding transcriptional LysR family regulator